MPFIGTVPIGAAPDATAALGLRAQALAHPDGWSLRDHAGILDADDGLFPPPQAEHVSISMPKT
jgi:hypothetical protein